MIMASVSITQKKSLIGYPARQRRTMRALGFGLAGKMNKTVNKEMIPATQGMLNQVAHLVVVENK